MATVNGGMRTAALTDDVVVAVVNGRRVLVGLGGLPGTVTLMSGGGGGTIGKIGKPIETGGETETNGARTIAQNNGIIVI